MSTSGQRPRRLWILGGGVLLIAAAGVAVVQGQSTTAPAANATTDVRTIESQPDSLPTTIAAEPGSLQPVIGVENTDGKRIVIGGFVSSEQEKATLIAEAQTAFSGLTVVTSGVQVDALVRPMADITTLIGALRQVKAPMSFTSSSETTYQLSGIVADESTKVAVFNGVAAGVGVDPNAVTNRLTVG